LIQINDLFLWNLWLDISGKPEIEYDMNPDKLSYEDIKRTQWNQGFHDLADHYLQPYLRTLDARQASLFKAYKNAFVILCQNRMVQGFFRYGALGNQGMIDRAGYLMKKGLIYEETGNKECLIDCANVAMAEYMESRHPRKHFAENTIHIYICKKPGMVASVKAHLYRDFGNLKHLIDIRNLALVEYFAETHTNTHFESIQDSEHGERRK
jgi:hypothetical protein